MVEHGIWDPTSVSQGALTEVECYWKCIDDRGCLAQNYNKDIKECRFSMKKIGRTVETKEWKFMKVVGCSRLRMKLIIDYMK